MSRISIRIRTLGALALLAVAAACGGGGESAEAEPTTTTRRPRPTTTTTEATTTTPPPPPPTAPLTGLPLTDPAVLARPALVVKIDNADPKSRPQQGLNQADVVYEEMVEGNVTRFASVFHSQNALGRVIPVRSARTTDIALFTPLNYPLFSWSGANADFRVIIRNSAMVDVGYSAASDQYTRDRGRPSPNNIFTTTEQLFSLAPAGSVAPPPLFAYRPAGEPVAGAAGPVSHVHVSFGGGAGSAPVDWNWDPFSGSWLRSQKGSGHLDEAGQQIAPKNVVVQFVTYHDTGYIDTSGTPVYEADLVGSGEAWILTEGVLIPATWSKPSVEAVTQYLDAAGQPVKLTPGQTWVQLPWPGRVDAWYE